MNGSADVNFITRSGDANFSQDYFEHHEREIRQLLITKIEESYKNTTYQQYPEKLIDSITACHKDCLSNLNVSCHAIPTDQNTVIFDVEYHVPTDVNLPKVRAIYKSNLAVPKGIRPVSDINVAGKDLQIGPNLFQLDRSSVADAFTVTCNNSIKSCSDTVPARSSQSVVPPPLKTSCEFDAGFANSRESVFPPFKCSGLPPGSKYAAVFDGSIETDGNQETSWVEAALQSDSADPANAPISRARHVNDTHTPLNVVLYGTVPQTDDDARGVVKGEVKVVLFLAVCQYLGTKVTCSTQGPAHLHVFAFTP